MDFCTILQTQFKRSTEGNKAIKDALNSLITDPEKISLDPAIKINRNAITFSDLDVEFYFALATLGAFMVKDYNLAPDDEPLAQDGFKIFDDSLIRQGGAQSDPYAFFVAEVTTEDGTPTETICLSYSHIANMILSLKGEGKGNNFINANYPWGALAPQYALPMMYFEEARHLHQRRVPEDVLEQHYQKMDKDILTHKGIVTLDETSETSEFMGHSSLEEAYARDAEIDVRNLLTAAFRHSHGFDLCDAVVEQYFSPTIN